MASIKFIGCGAAFNTEDLQSNMLITADNGKRMLIDCGSFAPFALKPEGINSKNVGNEIDSIYISHCHADHIGGLEWVGFCTYFNPAAPKPKMYIHKKLVTNMDKEIQRLQFLDKVEKFLYYANSELVGYRDEDSPIGNVAKELLSLYEESLTLPPLKKERGGMLWQSLKAGLQSLEGKVLELEDLFDVRILEENVCFEWEEINFCPVQTVHVMNGREIVDSYGLLINSDDPENTTFLTTDTQFCPRQIEHFYDKSKLVFQDCETAPFKSGVHAHYTDLVTLPEKTKEKMWLYHYQEEPPQDAEGDGFAGFIERGQSFEL
ncbi:MAG: MBL fold metallo-hydrolase [Candidatus Thorarchaeota archaeon]|jgi:ribonuclease BN (tRNA processing enzyme)